MRAVKGWIGAGLAGLLMVGACGKPATDPVAHAAEEARLVRPAKTPVQAADPYYRSAVASVLARAGTDGVQPKAKNVIIFIGDGMGISTITASRIYAGQAAGKDGESYRLAMETLPYLGLSKTYSHDAQVPDSAATATAIYTGAKTRSRVLGVSSEAAYNNCASIDGRQMDTLFELAEDAGLATGVISTARLTHATPGAAYAKSPNRDWETDGKAQGGCADIARQFLDWPHGDGFEVALAGGRSEFLPAEMADPEYPEKSGARTDGRNLADEWRTRGNDRAYVWDKAGFDALNFDSDVRVLGLFEPSHMQYEIDRKAAPAPGEPSLAELTRAAILRLSRDPDGFILLVEGGRIDHAHHGTNAARALADTVALDEAIAMALAMTSPEDTLIIVTADHSHTLVIQGYQSRGNPILGVAAFKPGGPALAGDGKAYTTLAYANGPGAACAKTSDPSQPCVRPDPAQADTTAPDYLQQALLPMASETHGGEDVAIFASGPGAQMVRGVMEQNEIFHVIGLSTGLIAAE